MSSLRLVQSQTVSGGSTSSVTFSNIPQVGTHLMMTIYAKTNRTGGTNDRLYLNDEKTGGKYPMLGMYLRVYGDGAFTNDVQNFNGAAGYDMLYLNAFPTEGHTGNGALFSSTQIWFPNFKNNSKNKSLIWRYGFSDPSPNTGYYSATSGIFSGEWTNSSSAITSITFSTEEAGVFYTSGCKFHLYVLE